MEPADWTERLFFSCPSTYQAIVQLEPGLANLLIPPSRLSPAHVSFVHCVVARPGLWPGGSSDCASHHHEQSAQAMPHAQLGHPRRLFESAVAELSALCHLQVGCVNTIGVGHLEVGRRPGRADGGSRGIDSDSGTLELDGHQLMPWC